MIDPQTLDLSALPSLPMELKSTFPKQSAIYFAIDSLGTVQYIGRTNNLKERWSRHNKLNELRSIGNIRIAYLLMELDLLSSIESALIDWFKPPLNISKFVAYSPRTQKIKVKNKLKDLMEDRNLTQADVVRATGLSKTTVNHFYLNYTDRLDLKTIKTLCEYFDLTKIDDLISLED